MAAAAFVVTLRDSSGDPVNMFGICAAHGPENLFVKQAIKLSEGQNWRRMDCASDRVGRFSVQQVAPERTSWTCEICGAASCADLL